MNRDEAVRAVVEDSRHLGYGVFVRIDAEGIADVIPSPYIPAGTAYVYKETS